MTRIARGTKPWDGLMDVVLDGIEGKADAALAALADKMSKTANLADLEDLNEARSILDVYTKAEADGLFSAGNGIADITLVNTTGLIDTYQITFDDGGTKNYDVKNGRGVTGVALQSTSGLNKTYRMTFNDGSTFDFVVANGSNGSNGNDGVGITGITLQSTAPGPPVVKTYRISRSDGGSFDFSVTDGLKGDKGDTGATPPLRATSTTSRLIGTGSASFAVPTMAVAFPVGMVVRATSDSDPSNYMAGMVTAATPTSVTINVTEIGGSGTKADWTLVIGAFRGTQGPQGSANIFGPAGSVPGPYPDGTVTYEY